MKVAKAVGYVGCGILFFMAWSLAQAEDFDSSFCKVKIKHVVSDTTDSGTFPWNTIYVPVDCQQSNDDGFSLYASADCVDRLIADRKQYVLDNLSGGEKNPLYIILSSAPNLLQLDGQTYTYDSMNSFFKILNKEAKELEKMGASACKSIGSDNP